jgi:protein TonB
MHFTHSERVAFAAAIALHGAGLLWLPAWRGTTVPVTAPPVLRISFSQSPAAASTVAPQQRPPEPSAQLFKSMKSRKPLVDKAYKPALSVDPQPSTVSSVPAGEKVALSTFTAPATHPVASSAPAAPFLDAMAKRAPEPSETARPDHAHNPPPDYPPLARRYGLSGRVIMRVLVEASGEAREVIVASSSGHELLDRAALKSVRDWRFLPARRGAQAFAAWVEFPVRFELAN